MKERVVIRQRFRAAIGAFLILLLLCALVGCSEADCLYRGEIAVEQIDSPYTPGHIYFDNEWLQRKSLLAVEGLDLQKTKDFFAYVDMSPFLLFSICASYCTLSSISSPFKYCASEILKSTSMP